MISEKLIEQRKKKLSRRVAYLSKVFSQNPAALNQSEKSELDTAKQILDEITRTENELSNDRPRAHNVKNNDLEYWTLLMMKTWLGLHPEIGNSIGNKNAAIYKFAVAFFVENIVLNAQNNSLSLERIIEKLTEGSTNTEKQDREVSRDLKDIKLLVSFLTSMQLEENTLPVEGNARKLNPLTFEHLGTEIDEQSELGMALRAYKKSRVRDMINKKSSQSTNRTSW